MSDRKYRFHLLGLVHLPTARKYSSCAFTGKNVRLARMLCSLGHEVFLYGVRSTEEPPLEEYVQSDRFHFVECETVRSIRRDYGDGDNRSELGYWWGDSDWRHDFSSARKPSTLAFYGNAVQAIEANKRPDDFLLATQGNYHSPIVDAVKLFLTCEPGIGYRGSVAGRFRAFESDYIRNFTAGSEHPYECINGSYYDRTISQYIDPEDIEFSAEKDDYYLFIGRQIKRKGILTADLVCRHLNKKLIIVGQGARVTSDGWLVPITDPDFRLPPGTWEYHGYANVEQRKQLMAHAIATFAPTEYLECFATVHAESLLSGTPPITTDFGVFPGTISHEANNTVAFRCNTLDDFVRAAIAAKKVDPYAVREYGERFLMDNVKWEFQKWFEDLTAVYESATQPGVKGWHRITVDGANP
jgi:glycosyltransferase involved in cell wall biosynthesis